MQLGKERSQFLARLTVEAVETLGGDALCLDPDGHWRQWRSVRVHDLLVIDQHADESAPRSVNCYFTAPQDIDPRAGLAEHGRRFAFSPDHLLFAVRWLHKGTPPDVELVLAPPFKRAPDLWLDYSVGVLLGALQRADPGLRERIADATAP